MNICVIIAAAGRSTRFGAGDKLAADLGGRPLLNRTVEIFAKCEEVRSIIVAGPPDDFGEFKRKFGPALSFHGAQLVEGGREARWETIRNALAAPGMPEDATHIAVHDAARPGVSAGLLNRLFTAARSLAAVVPGVPIHGTVKRGSPDETTVGEADDAVADLILGEAGKVMVKARPVIETLDRANLYEIQTPQVFEAGLLKRAYAQIDPGGATDDASLIERLGQPVYLVPGESRNIKITTQEDVQLMRAILGVKPPDERPVHMRF